MEDDKPTTVTEENLTMEKRVFDDEAARKLAERLIAGITKLVDKAIDRN